jgi:hypothetical protein
MIDVRPIDYKVAIDYLLPRHYSGRKPQVKYAFGLYEETVLVGVITYGIPASRPLCIGVLGIEHYASIIELNRVCITGAITASSSFLATTLKMIKKHNLVVVSYADMAMGHIGTLYQATNFIYTGATKRRTDRYTEGNKHSRHYDKDAVEVYRKVRSAKHSTFTLHAIRPTRKNSWVCSSIRLNLIQVVRHNNMFWVTF